MNADKAIWTRHAADLADWTARMLVNRSDACGGYRAHPTTRKATDGDWRPFTAALRSHYTGDRLVGLHAANPATQSGRWIAIDIDAHNGESETANLRAATYIADQADTRGLTAHIFDSDGRGGLHIWIVFDRQVPTAQLYMLACELTAGCGVTVETFPASPHVPLGGYGHWIRLPGRHHSRPHWTRLWTGAGWATAESTVLAILAIEGDSPVNAMPHTQLSIRSSRRSSKSRQPVIANDDDATVEWSETHDGVTFSVC